MTVKRTRLALLGVFGGCLAVQIGFLLFAAAKRMWPEDLQKVLVAVLAVYSAQLGVIVSGIFAEPKRSSKKPQPAIAWAAILLSIVWNLLLAWRSISFSLASEDSPADLVGYFNVISSSASFLVAGALVLFFNQGAGSN
jgi:hypothetical protein